MPACSGTVKDESGNFVRRLIRLYRQDNGAFVGHTLSDATTGAWLIATADTSAHFAVRHDTTTINPYWDKTCLVMSMDDTGLTDRRGHVITLNGNAARSSAQSKFGGYSAVFDGSGDYLSTPAHADFNFGTGDFDIRVQTRFSSHTTVQSIAGNYINSTTGWVLQRRSDTNTLRFAYGDTTLLDSSWTPSDNTWHEIYVSRNGTNLRIFVGGTQVGSTVTNSTNISGGGPLWIGGLNFGGGIQYFDGYLDDLVIRKAAEHTGTYTPLASAYDDSTGTVVENALIYDSVIPV